MKKTNLLTTLLLFIAVLFAQNSWGQIAVTVTNPTNTTPNLDASYVSLANAITAINAVTAMSGPVIFTLADGGTETAPAAGYILGNATLNPLTSATNTITFQKSGAGANPLITAFTPGTSTTVDGIWKIAGTNYVTISGISLQENAANITATQQMEWGFAIVKLSLSDGSQNITITNCNVSLNKANTASVGIYGGNHIATATTALVVASAPGTNANIKVNGCTVSNCYNPIYIAGYTTLAWYDTGLEIGTTTANMVSNYGGGASTTYGIYINGQNAPKIENNLVTLGTGTTTTAYGINVASACIGNLKINANTVSVSSSATTSSLAAINNLAPIATTLDITNNIIQNCIYATATSGNFYGIYEQAAITGCTVNITGNTISGLTYSGVALAGNGTIYCIYKTGGTPTAVNVNSNTINGNALTGTTGGTFYGVYLNSGTTQTANSNNIYNNTIGGTGTSGTIYGIRSVTGTVVHNLNTIYNNKITKATGTGAIYGIYNLASPTNENYNNNVIYGLSSAGASQVSGIYTNTAAGVRTVSGNTIYTLSSAGGTVYGIYQAASSPSIFKNKIYDMSSSNATGQAHGIYMSSGTTVAIYNNLIGDLRTPAGTQTAPIPSLTGIYLSTGTTMNVYFNTVYLNATSSGTNFGTAAIYASTSPTTVNLRNNVFVNSSTPNGTGKASAYQRSAIVLTNYASTSNNNLFYAGINPIMFDGTNPYTSLAAYKTAVGPTRDAASISENPTWVSTAGSDANFLHINTTIATGIESGAATIATYTTDFDGDIRNVTTPDIGADEFTGVPLPICAGTPASSTISGVAAVCSGAGTTLTLSTTYTDLGITYQWASSTTLGGPYTTTLGTANLQATGNLTATTYYVCTITCSGSGLSFTTVEKSVSVNAIPTAGSSNNSPICSGSTLYLTGTTDIGTSFSWTGPNGFAQNSQSPSIPTATAAASGTYSFIAIANGCSSTPGTTIVTVNQTPSAVVITPGAATISAGAIQQLEASGGTVTGVAILSENFNGAAPLWTITNAGTSPLVSNWYYQATPFTDAAGSATFSNFTTVEGGKFALSNSDAGGSGSTTDSKLASPTFSTVGFTSATLTFEHGYRSYSGDATVAIEISTNGGGSWSVLKNYKGTSVGTTTNNFQTTANENISLDSYLNQASLKIRFNYVSVWGYYWIIDNVSITGAGSAAFTWSPTSGLYTDNPPTIAYDPITYPNLAIVYAKPTVTRTYISTATSAANCTNNASVTVTVNQTDATWTGALNTDWGIAGNWSTDVPVSTTDVTIPNVDNDPIVNQAPGSPAICNTLTITDGFLTIAAGKALTVNGTLTNSNGTTGLVVESGSSLITNSNVVGSATVKCTIPSASAPGAWHFISAPVSNAVSDMFTGNYLQELDETNYIYNDITALGTAIAPMKGYALWSDAVGFPLSFTGDLNNATSTTIAVTRTALVAPKEPGWNLVGNPFPSYIDWNNAGWDKTNVNASIYIERDGAWAIYNGVTGTNGGSQYIAPCQGFLVEASSTGSLIMDNTVRTHNSAPFFKNSQDVVDNLIRIQVSGNGYTDEAVVMFLPEATSEFDGKYDAHKLYSSVTKSAQVYTLGITPLAINTMPEASTVPVGIHVGVNGTFTISATEINDFSKVTLEDTKTAVFTDLLTSSYTFNFVPGENEQRFVLHFGPLSVNEIENSDAIIYSYHETVYVNMKDKQVGDIYIYNIAGQLVATKMSAQGMNEIGINKTGNYIVKVITRDNTLVKKVFIN